MKTREEWEKIIDSLSEEGDIEKFKNELTEEERIELLELHKQYVIELTRK